MAFGHLLDTLASRIDVWGLRVECLRVPSEGLEHLDVMDTTATPHEIIEPVLTISDLAAHLSVSVQTLYDLRSKGRGPRGFRVGRELRFRQGEVAAWLERLEAADGRHTSGTPR
jgi:excisionase family DNA binding protein